MRTSRNAMKIGRNKRKEGIVTLNERVKILRWDHNRNHIALSTKGDREDD